LELSRVGATAVLTMNRPEQRNALDMELRAAFAAAVPQVRDDASVRAVVLTGAGGHFCAGGDVKAIAAGGDSKSPAGGDSISAQGGQPGARDIFEGRDRIRSLHRWFDDLVDLEKPVIAAVDGVAYGAGLSLALAADMVLASPRATFCSVFARLGFVPDLGQMYLLPRAVGLARAKELAFSTRVVDAREAQAIGLVMRVCEGPADSDGSVLQEALALAERFHAAPTQALGLMKGVMNRAFESERRDVYAQEAMAQAICRESAFHQEAVRRFVVKEPPLYRAPESKG
jgi:enoyl-CoA hydratase/carnithine racemase